MRLMECERCGKTFLRKDPADSSGSFIRSGKSLVEELHEEWNVYCPDCNSKQKLRTLAMPV